MKTAEDKTEKAKKEGKIINFESALKENERRSIEKILALSDHIDI